MNFTPFPRQVRLIRLGQDETYIPVETVGPGISAEDLKRAQDRIAALRSRIQATAMRPDVRQAFLEKLQSCEAMFYARRDADSDRCLKGIEEALSNPLLPNLTTQGEIERQNAELAKRRAATTTWEWIGLAALAAGIGWFIYKK